MSDGFDFYTLIFLVLAVVVFLRLRNVLGRRTGHERPPVDPYSARDTNDNAPAGKGDDKVVPLPSGRTGADLDDGREEIEERIEAIAPKGSALGKGLASIADADRNFDPETFIKGARAAYEMIVNAFAEGDRRSLKSLLSREVYDGFVGAIAEREKRDEIVDSSFVGIDKAEITDAALKDRIARVTVKFVSQLISATHNRDGELIDGDPKKVREVTDSWTFARDIRSRDPNWKLVATGATD